MGYKLPRSERAPGRQAQWLAQYKQYAIVIEGHADERGTREYNLALGARRAAATRDYLIFPRRRRQPPEDHLLRQGAAGGGVRRHLVLVAEPARGDDAGRRRSVARADRAARLAVEEETVPGSPGQFDFSDSSQRFLVVATLS
jgi:hypothetical protein